MSTSEQSSTPYPWQERRKFNDSRRLIRPVVKVLRPLMLAASILSPPSLLAWFWGWAGFRKYNDSWARRGLMVLGLGALAVLVVQLFWPMLLVDQVLTLFYAFGTKATATPLIAWIMFVGAALPYALVIHGLYSLARSFQIERSTEAFMNSQSPTPGMRRRAKRNIAELSSGEDRGKGEGGYVRFGVIVGDRIPWRRSRYGMAVEMPLERIGHGVIVGRSGMGKTKTAETFAHYALISGRGMVYIDFKGSRSTRDGLVAVARSDDANVHTFDVGIGSQDTTWYDLFAWDGSPSDKASVLVECLSLPTGEGGSRHYRNIAEAWLPRQIEAAQIVGLGPDEGMFDFLLETAAPVRFTERTAPMRTSDDPAIRAKYERWDREISTVKAADLEGLRSELSKIAQAAGRRLKPNSEHPKAVSMRDVMDDGGLLYVGIAQGINDVVVKVLGSFLMKELSIIVSERVAMDDTSGLRECIVIPDEASLMKERSVMLNPIYQNAREARIYMWPGFQSFADWDESTAKEIQSNARGFIAFDIPETGTAEILSGTLASIPCRVLMQQEETQHQALQGQSIGTSGDTRYSIVLDRHLRPTVELKSVPQFHAYMWFKDDAPLSRDRWWWGKRRVRKSDIRGDAPLVRMVPYALALTEGEDLTNALAVEPVVSAPSTATVPAATAPIVLGATGDSGAAPKRTLTGDGYAPDITEEAEADAVQPQAQHATHELDDEPTGGHRRIMDRGADDAPPSLPSFIAKRRGAVSATREPEAKDTHDEDPREWAVVPPQDDDPWAGTERTAVDPLDPWGDNARAAATPEPASEQLPTGPADAAPVDPATRDWPDEQERAAADRETQQEDLSAPRPAADGEARDRAGAAGSTPERDNRRTPPTSNTTDDLWGA